MSGRHLAGLTILLGLAAASWFLASSLETPPPQPPDPGANQQGYYLRSARILGTGDAGQLLYEIEAEYAEQGNNDQIAFDNVSIHYAPDADVPWSVSADQALITGTEQRLTLTGHVVAVSKEGFAGAVTEIRTDWLELDPENYRAATDQRVQIRIGEQSLTATGMEALFNENRLQLNSNVSGKFLPR
ncbi:MAG: LPS export ABC transporter periplasmic protein LptC [Halioglobus sp.]|nr:LPS export ABC transporter periplasmic protein LptC [Halioglobus sp.]